MKNSKELTKRQKAKLETNIVSSRSCNYMQLKNKKDDGKVEFIGEKPTARAYALLDVIHDRFIKQNDFKALYESPLNDEIYPSKFNEIVHNKNGKKTPTYSTNITLDGKEIREALGLPRYTDKEIWEDTEILAKATIKALGVRLWFFKYGDNGAVMSLPIDFVGNLLGSAIKKEIGIAPRTKSPQYRFYFNLIDATLMVWCNDAINRRLSLFSKKFYRLPDGCQLIFRFLSLFPEPHLNIKQMADILDLDITKTRPQNLIRQIDRYFKRLAKEGFINKWKRRGRGLKTVWDIWGIDSTAFDYRKPPIRIEAERVEEKEEEREENYIQGEIVEEEEETEGQIASFDFSDASI